MVFLFNFYFEFLLFLFLFNDKYYIKIFFSLSFVKENYLLLDPERMLLSLWQNFQNFPPFNCLFAISLVGISAGNPENSHCVLNGTYGVLARDGHCNSQEKHDKVKLDSTSITRFIGVGLFVFVKRARLIISEIS